MKLRWLKILLAVVFLFFLVSLIIGIAQAKDFPKVVALRCPIDEFKKLTEEDVLILAQLSAQAYFMENPSCPRANIILMSDGKEVLLVIECAVEETAI